MVQVRSSGFCRGFFFEVLPHSFLHPDEPSLSRTPLDTSCSLWALEADDTAIETQLLATVKEDNEFEGLGEEEPFYTGSYNRCTVDLEV